MGPTTVITRNIFGISHLNSQLKVAMKTKTLCNYCLPSLSCSVFLLEPGLPVIPAFSFGQKAVVFQIFSLIRVWKQRWRCRQRAKARERDARFCPRGLRDDTT